MEKRSRASEWPSGPVSILGDGSEVPRPWGMTLNYPVHLMEGEMPKDDMLVRIRLMVEIADLLYNAGHVEAARLIQDLSYKEHKAWKDKN